ncbi:MAG: type II secretion system F family protein [Desulfovibrionaceae bacterium]|jgi:general secretion pathway protein F/type IV pilus assembly protein PilC|nr:type II secretion system F family protein [Desulfovibrionaceae bacterium]
MPTFQYQALDGRGKKKKGFIEADTQARAFSMLQDQSLLPVSLAPVADKGGRATGRFGPVLDALRGRFGGGVRVGESFHYLGMLLQTGTSLSDSLEMLGRMSGRAARIWLDVRDAVETGQSFSQALGAYPRLFPAVYVGMVQVAERVGRLGQVLEKIAHYEEQRAEVSGKLVTALIYPCTIMVVGIGAVYFLLSNVLPKIAGVFTSARQELPTNTKILLAVGGTLHDLGPAVLLVPLLLVLGLTWAYNRGGRFRQRVDALLWRVPLVQKDILARFSGMLGFQLESGIPLVQAMESSSQAVGSTFFKTRILEAKNEVAAGQPLDRVLARQKAFPDIFLMTLSTGQRSGKLGPFLLRIGRLLERDVDNMLKRLVALAEPLLILAVGLVVAFIVLSIMGPIFELTTLVH